MLGCCWKIHCHQKFHKKSSQVKLRILEYIHLKGMENVTMDDVIKATAVKARSMVPDNIVKELQQEVKNYRDEKYWPYATLMALRDCKYLTMELFILSSFHLALDSINKST